MAAQWFVTADTCYGKCHFSLGLVICTVVLTAIIDQNLVGFRLREEDQIKVPVTINVHSNCTVLWGLQHLFVAIIGTTTYPCER